MEKITVYSDALGGVEKLRGVAATWWSFGVSTCALALSQQCERTAWEKPGLEIP